MNEPTLQTLAQRFDTLERQNRWWKGATACSLLALSSLLLMGQTSRDPDVVVARAFVLKSPDDKVVAILGENTDWMVPHPSLKDVRNGSYRTQKDTWGLHVYGPNVLQQVSLQLMLGGSALLLSDGETNSYINLSTGKFVNSQMKVGHLAHLDMNVSHQPKEEDRRRSIESVAKLRSANTEAERDEAHRTFYHSPPPEYRALLEVSNDVTGLSLSETANDELEERVVLGNTKLQNHKGEKIERPLSSLVFFDKDKKVMWEAP